MVTSPHQSAHLARGGRLAGTQTCEYIRRKTQIQILVIMDGMAQELSISNTQSGRGRGGTSDIVGPALSIIFCVIDGMFVMLCVGIGCSGCYCPHILSPNSQSPLTVPLSRRRKYVASHKGFLWTDCNSRFQPLLSPLSPLSPQ